MCPSCTAQDRCTAWASVQSLRAPDTGPLLRERFYSSLQAVHQRGETHITARELRAVLSYVFFGVDSCEDLHAKPDDVPGGMHERAFSPYSPRRQGDVLHDLEFLDPALEANPRIDRRLLQLSAVEPPAPLRFGALSLPSARRLAYFLWPTAEVTTIGGSPEALGLARGRHLKAFLTFPLKAKAEQDRLRDEICEGIARLENLPPMAFQRTGAVPFKITPRTPTETALWVEKSLGRFSLAPGEVDVAEGVETLHTHLQLAYHYPNGSEDRLRIGVELFHVLMDLREGVQLSDAHSEATFANLTVFSQRLAQEDSRELLAWNPLEERELYRLRAELKGGLQTIACERVTGEGD